MEQLDSIDNRARSEDLNTTSNGASEEKIVVGGGTVKLSKNVSKENTKNATKNPDINSVKKPKQFLNKKRTAGNRFTTAEDKILLEAINSGEELDFTKLAKRMKRNSTSVQHRVLKLKLSGGDSSRSSLTLQEDLAIIDSATKHLKEFSKLDDVFLKDAEVLAASFRRSKASVRHRWDFILKVWVKSYYTGTLNLNIKVMLANVIADNFEDIDSIDWNWILRSFNEFAGHTLASIRRTFYNNIYKSTIMHSKDDKTKVTLKDIAKDAAVTYSNENARKISDSTLARQREVIEHFEKKTKELGIKDFL